MQNIILGIACTNTPEQARIILIDPKLGVDYFAFEGLPHLQGGVIDDQDNATGRLNELVDEMNRRYTVLKENKVSNIFDLNRKVNPTERLPFLWVIHDEFAEWTRGRIGDHIRPGSIRGCRLPIADRVHGYAEPLRKSSPVTKT
jgi:DNA segregation ATPase FtsK/SpoIIIE, S-DNA-T family